jgi:hypothetical protein
MPTKSESSFTLLEKFSIMRHLLCLLFIVPTLVSAQSRSCRILYLGAPESAPEKIQLFDGKSSQEVELPRMNLSPVYNLPAGPLVIRMLSAVPAKPEDVSPDAPKASIPEAMTDLYLLVSSDASNKIAPVRMQVIDADSSKFKKGQMLWFNLTPNSVGGKLGSETLAMKPNSKVIVNAPASNNEDYPVILSYRAPGDDRLNPLCETRWQHDTGARSIFFVIAQEGSRLPRILGFPDRREIGEKAPQP